MRRTSTACTGPDAETSGGTKVSWADQTLVIGVQAAHSAWQAPFNLLPCLVCSLPERHSDAADAARAAQIR